MGWVQPSRVSCAQHNDYYWTGIGTSLGHQMPNNLLCPLALLSTVLCYANFLALMPLMDLPPTVIWCDIVGFSDCWCCHCLLFFQAAKAKGLELSCSEQLVLQMQELEDVAPGTCQRLKDLAACMGLPDQLRQRQMLCQVRGVHWIL
jgi:hypothetical protein